jgi:hypothetical protein
VKPPVLLGETLFFAKTNRLSGEDSSRQCGFEFFASCKIEPPARYMRSLQIIHPTGGKKKHASPFFWIIFHIFLVDLPSKATKLDIDGDELETSL